jgi:hypothetical protein
MQQKCFIKKIYSTHDKSVLCNHFSICDSNIFIWGPRKTMFTLQPSNCVRHRCFLSPKSIATRLLQLQTASATASHGEKQEPDIEVGTWGSDEKTGGRRAWGSLPRCARGQSGWLRYGIIFDTLGMKYSPKVKNVASSGRVSFPREP